VCSLGDAVGCTLLGGCDLFLRSIHRQVPVSSTRWFGDEGLQMLLGVLPQMMFFQRLLDLVVSRDGF
jgi:hypothetical protein